MKLMYRSGTKVMSMFSFYTCAELMESGHQRGRSLYNAPLMSQEEVQKAFEIIDEAVEVWKDALGGAESVDLPELSACQWELGGSLATGTFSGPKPRRFSYNQVPVEFDWIIEADVRLLLPEGVHPHDDRLLDLLKDILGANGVSPKLHVPRWGVSVPTIGIYAYLPHIAGIGIEFEVSIYDQATYFEIASVWRDLFSREEILWQTLVREYLRGLDDGAELLNKEKSRQLKDARWRLVGLLALAVLDDRGSGGDVYTLARKLQALQPPDTVLALVERWLSGETGAVSGLEIPDEDDLIALRSHAPELLRELPSEPSWVVTVRSVQQACIRARRKFEGLL